jgi:hypothetical protein
MTGRVTRQLEPSWTTAHGGEASWTSWYRASPAHLDDRRAQQGHGAGVVVDRGGSSVFGLLMGSPPRRKRGLASCLTLLGA